jgi:2-C-methyl-D-erythritol 4-phosphate cytidylyltransferase/2-C-methyl-D-erythritol 2,4-cyclodiphosphate synthase
VANVDVTIVCESPRIGPHVQAMRQSIGGVLDVPVSAVSIKATTTEGLGLCGRGEGIAATAVALIQGV